MINNIRLRVVNMRFNSWKSNVHKRYTNRGIINRRFNSQRGVVNRRYNSRREVISKRLNSRTDVIDKRHDNKRDIFSTGE
jgi:hypothetical protein